MAISNVTLFSIAIRFQFGNERFLIALFCTFPVSRDRYPRYWSQDTIKLASLECLVNRLQRTEVLECHTGCVNTVRWNHNGTKIVSGSDDCHLGIWNIHFHHDVESKLISRFETGHQANIFHALFVPHTDDDEIISAALDCDVRYNIISREQSQRIGTHNGPCHKLDIITPKVFISCSEDGTIKLMDLRDKSTINTTRSAAAVQNTFIRLFKFKHITTPRSTTNNPQIKNGTNPQNHHNQGPSSCSPKSEISISGSALPKITTEKESRFSDESGVTGLAWSYDGRELCASYSGNSIARFRVDEDRSCRDFTDCTEIIRKHADSEQQSRELFRRLPLALADSSDAEDIDDDEENPTESLADGVDEDDAKIEDSNDDADDHDADDIDNDLSDDQLCDNNLCENANEINESNVMNEDQEVDPDEVDTKMQDHRPDTLHSQQMEHFDNLRDRIQHDLRSTDLQNEIVENEEINDVNAEDEAQLDEDDEVRRFLEENQDEHDLQEDNDNIVSQHHRERSVHSQSERDDLEDVENEEDTKQSPSEVDEAPNSNATASIHAVDIVDGVDDETRNSNHNDRVKKAVSKVKGLMSGLKEKANQNGDRLRQKVRNRMPFNLFSKSSGSSRYFDSFEKGYIPYSLQIGNYCGHRTVETVKECNFFGPRSEYIISGSDCRRVFIWNKETGKLVNVLEGDARITNVVQGNPVNCSLVTSGLDDTVKVFTPTAPTSHREQSREREREWERVREQNRREIERSGGPIPMSLLVYLLRRGIYGFDQESDSDGDAANDDRHRENDAEDDEDDDDDDDAEMYGNPEEDNDGGDDEEQRDEECPENMDSETMSFLERS